MTQGDRFIAQRICFLGHRNVFLRQRKAFVAHRNTFMTHRHALMAQWEPFLPHRRVFFATPTSTTPLGILVERDVPGALVWKRRCTCSNIAQRVGTPRSTFGRPNPFQPRGPHSNADDLMEQGERLAVSCSEAGGSQPINSNHAVPNPARRPKRWPSQEVEPRAGATPASMPP